jgi:hypothetical protein
LDGEVVEEVRAGERASIGDRLEMRKGQPACRIAKFDRAGMARGVAAPVRWLADGDEGDAGGAQSIVKRGQILGGDFAPLRQLRFELSVQLGKDA